MRDIAVVINNGNKNVTPIETIDAIKNAGFKNVFVQWYNEEGEYSQQEQLEYARKQGLNIIFTHLGYQNINDIWEKDNKGDLVVDRYKNDIKICKENNISLVIMHLTRKHNAPMYNEIGLRRIKEIVDYAKQLDVKLAFENTKIKGYLEYVFENIDNDNIGLCYDAGHCHAHFDDEFNYEMFKNRIFAVHLHDNDGTDDQHTLNQFGSIDWKEIAKKLARCPNVNLDYELLMCVKGGKSAQETLKECYKQACELEKMILKYRDQE